MRPRSLLRFCARCIAQSITDSISHLAITEALDKIHLASTLGRSVEWYKEVLFSNVVQDHLYKSFITCLRSHQNPSLYFTAMIVLCSKVTIDQIAVVEDHNGLPPLVAGTGLDITSEECEAIIEVLCKIREENIEGKNLGNKGQSLPTISLVLEGIYFHDPEFLSRLFKEMPLLRHIEFQYNGTPFVLKALSKNCPELESLSFLEPRMEVSVLEKDILPILFGIPPSANHRPYSALISKFAEDEDFRNLFVTQYPNLRKLNLDELYLEEDLLHDVYTLVLLLYPKLTCFGKHTGLTRSILSKFRRLWTIKHGLSYLHIDLYLTKAKFVESIYDVPIDVGMELKYIEDAVPMFKSLKSLELQKHYWSENDVGRFCRLFSSQVEAFSLCDLPVNNISSLSSIAHLRLTFTHQYSFDQVHLILDNCIHLQTLSIHSVFHEHMPANNDGMNLQQNFGRLMDEEQQYILDNLLVEELAHQMQYIQAFIGEAQEAVEGNPQAIGMHAAVGGHPVRNRSFTTKNHKIHSKLITLRIASLFEAARHPSEAFLLSLLERLPNLRNLCLGMWMGALSHRREHLTCTGNALVNVVTSRSSTKPLLTELEQLCCLPSGTEKEMCASLVRLAHALPSLHTIVVPALDSFLLTPTLDYFKNTSIEIRHKCATDQVFTHWEPEH